MQHSPCGGLGNATIKLVLLPSLKDYILNEQKIGAPFILKLKIQVMLSLHIHLILVDFKDNS